MAKAIHAANRDYDSPPDLISPKNKSMPPIQIEDNSSSNPEHE
jgi:hypothetical protein